jgi:hypothetical protein
VFSEPNKLNMVGIRSAFASTNKFDDLFIIFWKERNTWVGYSMPCTTDPGYFYLNKPINHIGTAILVGGSYKYKVGLHRNQYKALVQNSSVTVIRDADRNNVIDWAAKKETGWYGINIHRANVSNNAQNIENHSAGCQVIQNIDDYNFLMSKAITSQNMYGVGSLVYNLIDNSMIKNRVVAVAIAAAAAVLIYKFK